MLKRTAALLLTLLLLAAACPALANSWGLTGSLLDYVQKHDEYGDYFAQAGELDMETCDVAVMHSRYHNVLMIGGYDGADSSPVLLQKSTTAVYQPNDGRDGELRLEKLENDCFCLRYGDEMYCFGFGDSNCWLEDAYIGGFSLNCREDGVGYDVCDASGTDVWYTEKISARNFNIRLLPRSVEEVRHLTEMKRYLRALYPLTVNAESGEVFEGVRGGKTLPVYSAPDANSWRAAKGKAAVSLAGDVTRFGRTAGYDLISYEVSLRTSRIGCIAAGELAEREESPLLGVKAVTTCETYLTDDPLVSQYPQFSLPAQTAVTILSGDCGLYAYVDWTRDGQAVRGFVPLRDLSIVYAEPDETTAAALLGEWTCTGGGEFFGPECAFYADGTFRESCGVTGAYTVVRYDSSEGCFWDNPPARILLWGDDGYFQTYGLTADASDLSLTTEEGGCGFVRVTEPLDWDSIGSGDNG